jgi:hypothetical protein
MSRSDHLDLLWYMYFQVETCKYPVLYPAVENIPGGIIFFRGLQTSHTRAEDWKITFFPT